MIWVRQRSQIRSKKHDSEKNDKLYIIENLNIGDSKKTIKKIKSTRLGKYLQNTHLIKG